MGLNYERIMAYRPADIAVSYGERDCILYALGIGLGMDPLDPGQLKFVYERAGLEAFPTMAVVLGWPGRMTDPAFGVDERLVVAGDLKVVLHRPLAAGRAAHQPPAHQGGDRQGPRQRRHHPEHARPVAEDGTLVATVDSSTFARKHGGFGGKVTETPVPPAVPQTAPEAICDLPTPPNLALLYRLNGDENPLHADPAARQGRRASIGRSCTARRASASRRTRSCAPAPTIGRSGSNSIEARFSRPVFPGETIRTEMWPRGERISFQCRVVGRDEIVLSNGLAIVRA